MLARLICCCVVILFTQLPIGFSRAVDAQEPEPRRLGKPLIRAWFPTTLLQDRQEFLNELNQELAADSDDNQPVDSIPNQTPPQPVRHEGLLVYFDPIGEKKSQCLSPRIPQ